MALQLGFDLRDFRPVTRTMSAVGQVSTVGGTARRMATICISRSAAAAEQFYIILAMFRPGR